MHIHGRQSLESARGLLSSPYGVQDPPFPGLRHLGHRLLAGLKARRHDRRALADLAQMSDHMLADVGLARWDVRHVQRLPPRPPVW